MNTWNFRQDQWHDKGGIAGETGSGKAEEEPFGNSPSIPFHEMIIVLSGLAIYWNEWDHAWTVNDHTKVAHKVAKEHNDDCGIKKKWWWKKGDMNSKTNMTIKLTARYSYSQIQILSKLRGLSKA